MEIYLIGCIIATIILAYEYKKTPNDASCEINETIAIFSIGIMSSWCTVAAYLFSKYYIK